MISKTNVKILTVLWSGNFLLVIQHLSVLQWNWQSDPTSARTHTLGTELNAAKCLTVGQIYSHRYMMPILKTESNIILTIKTDMQYLNSCIHWVFSPSRFSTLVTLFNAKLRYSSFFSLLTFSGLHRFYKRNSKLVIKRSVKTVQMKSEMGSTKITACLRMLEMIHQNNASPKVNTFFLNCL